MITRGARVVNKKHIQNVAFLFQSPEMVNSEARIVEVESPVVAFQSGKRKAGHHDFTKRNLSDLVTDLKCVVM
jgi:hypothetical protein